MAHAPATPADVKLIMHVGSLADTQIQAHIDIAHQWVLQIEGTHTCLTDALVSQIEIMLSAHSVDSHANRVASRKIGDATDTYRKPGVLQTGFESTWYGQQALSLDCSGNLANLGLAKVTFAPFGGADVT